MAVFIIPVPKGLVIMTSSPTFEPKFLRILSGWTIPITDNPYFGSSSSTVWPPITTAPASITLSAPPLNISPKTSIDKQFGKHTIFKATVGFPPIAYTSLIEFAAAICPKV